MDPRQVDPELLIALAEANRLHMVELLGAAPRSVGEVAKMLGLRQPQATKHLKTLERSGIVRMHPLGRRRIYSLRRETLRGLREWLDGFDLRLPSEDVLAEYEKAIEIERMLSQRDPGWGRGRTIRMRRTFRGSARSIWPYWTRSSLLRRWWHPQHFTVAECEARAVAGGSLRIVLEEGDGNRHVATGRYLTLFPPNALTFSLGPHAPDGKPLFSGLYRVSLEERGNSTRLSIRIDITDLIPAAAGAAAGLSPGWKQLLDNLSSVIAEDG